MRLNLGSGGRTDPGWVHVDREFPPGSYSSEWFVTQDLTDPLPFDDDCCDGAVAHHVLDLIEFDQLDYVLAEIRRVLKPEAVLRISCADLPHGIWQAMQGNWVWFPEPIRYPGMEAVSLPLTLGQFILQGGARRNLLTSTGIESALTDAGFTLPTLQITWGTIGASWMRDLDSRQGESWCVEAIAP